MPAHAAARRLTTVLTAAVTASGLLGAVALPADAAIRISKVRYDAKGTDTTSNVNGEYVEITNTGNKGKRLSGWQLKDDTGHTFTFPSFKLGSGRTVTVRTGEGGNTGRTLYWGQGWHVWNNTGDVAKHKKPSGTTADTCRWGDGTGVTAC